MVKDLETFINLIQEEGWAYTIYATLNPKNKDTGYLFLGVWLYTVKELEIL